MLLNVRNKWLIQCVGAVLLLVLATNSYAGLMAGAKIAPPVYTTIDRFGVNVAAGQVSASLDTVSIGGASGLAHSISLNGNTIDVVDSTDGYRDKYASSSVVVPIGPWIIDGVNLTRRNASGDLSAFVLRVSALGVSADFKIEKNGIFVSTGVYVQSELNQISFEPRVNNLGSMGHKFAFTADGNRVWTQPDGTQVFFSGEGFSPKNSYFAPESPAYKIVSPNGYTVYIDNRRSVSSNTGFMLKYHYTSSGDSWTNVHPKYVFGLNLSSIYCARSGTSSCNLTSNSEWPKATFEWPAGMPLTALEQSISFKVTVASGGTAEYQYEPQNLNISDAQDPSSAILVSPTGSIYSDYVARLRRIIPPSADDPSVEYSYMNEFFGQIIKQHGYNRLGPRSGYVLEAKGPYAGYAYSKTYPTTPEAMMHWGPYYTGGPMAVNTSALGDPITISIDGVGTYQLNQRLENKLLHVFTNLNGPDEGYQYDARGNLVRGGWPEYSAVYPATCTNIRTCNKPISIKDKNGNETHYEYHAESGQVSKVTFPSGDLGLVPQGITQYKKLYAKTLNASGVLESMTDGIYMKVADAYCANSNWVPGSVDGWNGEADIFTSCTGSDGVITRYYYNHSNLLLTEQTIEADGQLLRTCFQYDRFGNQIGQTPPLANTDSCSI